MIRLPILLKGIQVDPEYVPTIRSVYTHDVAMKMGHLRPDEKTQMELALKAIDDEEKSISSFVCCRENY